MKIPKKDIWFILAAYNEEKAISKTIKNLQKAGYSHIIAVDDGSKDKTYEKARETGIIILQHKINRGQGAALRTGTDYALKNKAKYIIHFDADGQHRIEDIYDMMQPLLNKKAEITMGSRFLDKRKKSNLPLSRILFLKGGLLFTKIMTGLKITDTHNGFRAMTANAAKKLKITQDEMEHASEILELISRKKIRYKEVPVIIKYNNEIMANSTNNIRTAIKIILKTIWYKVVK